MDGNGRWAQSRGQPRNFGHIKGAKVARETIEECARIGIKHLTLYTFSTENWLRPFEEVSFLMNLLEKQLEKERETLIRNNVRFNTIGDRTKLPQGVLAQLDKTIEATANNTGMNLIFALSYGSRQEITNAAQQLAREALAGRLQPEDINEDLVDSLMSTSGTPDPDLIIRTSGEFRISNFLLWQAAYSEFFITEKPWPDFNAEELAKALDFFAKRERRFGKISASPTPPPS